MSTSSRLAVAQARIPASFMRRLAAMLYDGLLILAILFLAVLIVIYPTGGAVQHPLFSLYPLAIGFLFFGGFWVLRGQTLGMKTWQLWLLTPQGQRINWRQALTRYLLALASWGSLLIALSWANLHNPPVWLVLLACLPGGMAIAWAGFDGERSTLYDRLSGTRLVRIPAGQR